MDFEGLRARSIKEMKNGWAKIPAGSLLKIDMTGSPKGFGVIFDPCKCCGVQVSMSAVQPEDIELLDTEHNRALAQWNSERVRAATWSGYAYRHPEGKPKPIPQT